MKISGDDKRPVAILDIHLKSMNTSLRHYSCPFFPEFTDTGEYDRNAMRARIEFRDSAEIDMLIHALTVFRNKNCAYIGELREW